MKLVEEDGDGPEREPMEQQVDARCPCRVALVVVKLRVREEEQHIHEKVQKVQVVPQHELHPRDTHELGPLAKAREWFRLLQPLLAQRLLALFHLPVLHLEVRALM